MSSAFDKKGMINVPNIEEPNPPEVPKIIATELYCPNGHNLVSSRAKFGKENGVLVSVEQNGEKGLLAISTVCNHAFHITLDINLTESTPVKICCPECGVELPIHSQCHCGGEIITFFRTKECDYAEALGICNVVGCSNAHIIENGELTTICREEVL